MFCPGETVCHSFLIPFNSEDISKIIISYKAHGDIFFEKVITSDTAVANEYFINIQNENKTIIRFTLSQEESLLFPEDTRYSIQLNVLTFGGSRHTSKLIESKEHFQHIQNIISGINDVIPDGDDSSAGLSIVKQAYYAVFGHN